MFDRATFAGSVVLVTILLGLIVWGVYYVRQYEGIVTVDAFLQAQAAREFHLGRGLTTLMVSPISLRLGLSPESLPEAYLSPLPVILLARFLKTVGLNDGALLAFSLAGAAAAGILLFVFARVLFGDLVTAGLTFVVYAASLAMLESAFSGQGFALSSLLLLAYLWLYYRRKRNSFLYSGLLGAAAGLLYLSEFDFLFLALPLVVFLCLDSPAHRLGHVLSFLAAFLLVSLPWLVRNSVVFGNPFFSLRWFDFPSYSLPLPANRISRDLSPPGLSPFPLLLFWNKMMMFVRLMHTFWLSFSLSLLAPFFFGGLFLRFRDWAWSRAVRLAVVLFFFQLALIAAGNGDFARTLCFVPLLVIVGVSVFRELVTRLGPAPKWSWLLLGLFCLLNTAPGLISLAHGLPAPRYLPAIFTREEAAVMVGDGPMERLRKMVRADETVASDIPWAVAWYANRRALWIPWEIEQVREIRELVPRLRFLHLSPVIFKYPPSENPGVWRGIYRTGRVPDWLGAERGLLLPGDHLVMGDVIFERLDLE